MREHLGVGFTGENSHPACAHRWGNNLVIDAEWATSLIRPSSPSGLIESRHCRWIREVDVFSHPIAAAGSAKLMSSLALPSPICPMLHEIGSSSPRALLYCDAIEVEASHRLVVGRWGRNGVDQGYPRARRQRRLRVAPNAWLQQGTPRWLGRVATPLHSWWCDSLRGSGKP
jgi:hypothetical protein